MFFSEYYYVFGQNFEKVQWKRVQP